MTVLRALAAAALVAHSFVRPVLTPERLRLLLEHRPELAAGALVLESLPAVVGAAWLLRALRPGAFPRDGPFAAAGRWAALLAVAGLLFLPFHATDPGSALRELGLRAACFLGLALMLDGPLEPSA
jgi:hypothetical protein